MSCEFFYRGFETPQQRESHMNKHDRPFGCSFPQCYRATIRFSSKRHLEKHIAETHERQKRDIHSLSSKRMRLDLLCRVCNASIQDTKAYRVHYCPRSPPTRSNKRFLANRSFSQGVEDTASEPQPTALSQQSSHLIRTNQVEKLTHNDEQRNSIRSSCVTSGRCKCPGTNLRKSCRRRTKQATSASRNTSIGCRPRARNWMYQFSFYPLLKVNLAISRPGFLANFEYGFLPKPRRPSLVQLS